MRTRWSTCAATQSCLRGCCANSCRACASPRRRAPTWRGWISVTSCRPVSWMTSCCRKRKSRCVPATRTAAAARASRASTWPPPRESSPKRSHGSLLPWSGAADSAGFEPVVQPVQQHPVELSAVQVVHYFVSGGFELNDAPVPGTGAGEQLPAAGDAGDRVLGTVQDEQRQLQLACACKYFFAGDQQ